MLKVDGKIVESINVMEETDGEIKSFKISQNEDIQNKLEEIYNFIKDTKKADKQMGCGNCLKYHIKLETVETFYGDYKIVKHKNNKYSIEKSN